MIDRDARSKLSEAARALIAGRITNDEFESRIPRSEDPAIREIYMKGFWPNYADLKEHRMIGVAKWTGEKREFASRCIMFLKSDLPYVWPARSPLASLVRSVANLLTFGTLSRTDRRLLEQIGDTSEWPFRCREDYTAALESPPYLHGLGPNNSFKPTPLRGAA